MSVFIERLLASGIDGVDERSARDLYAYFQMLIDFNARVNLTAITDELEAADKHFIDSLSLLNIAPPAQGARLIDVGTGAGFPGLALKIVRPDLSVCLMDSTKKKLAFLQAVCDALKIRSVDIVHARAEDAGRDPKYRERFDAVCARAVAPLPVLCEYALPFAVPGGFFAAYKGPSAAQELRAAQNAIAALGGGGARLARAAALPPHLEHYIVLIQKRGKTPPAYPRPAAKVRSNPL